jgi:hypothetical protein
VRYTNRHTGRAVYTNEVATEAWDRRQESRAPKKPKRYMVYDKIPCFVRDRSGAKPGPWREFTTTKKQFFERYAWRNLCWYGFILSGYEMKIRAYSVHEV